MPSRKSIRDKLTTHTFFRQDPDNFECPHSCCGCAKSGSSQAGPGPKFNSIDPRDYNAGTDEIDKLIKDFKNHVAEETKRRKANIWDTMIPNDWGLSYVKQWEAIIEAEDTFSTEELELYRMDLRDSQRAMELEKHMKSGAPQPDILIRQQENLNKAMLCCSKWIFIYGIEKKFGFTAEAMQGLDTAGQTEEPGPLSEFTFKPETSLRMKLNAPIRGFSTMTERKGKARPSKRLPALSAVAEIQRHCKWLIKDFQTLSKDISDDYSKCLDLPATVWAYEQEIAHYLPESIRRSLWDLGFLRNQMFELHPQLLDQRELIRATLLIWIGSGDELWQWATEHIYDMPEFQKYEYMRNDMFSMYQMVFNDEEKVVDFLLIPKEYPGRSSDLPKLDTKQLEDFLKVGKRTKPERKDIFHKRLAELRASITSVHDMMETLRDYRQEYDAQVNTGFKNNPAWWGNFVSQLPVDLAKTLPPEYLRAPPKHMMETLRNPPS